LLSVCANFYVYDMSLVSTRTAVTHVATVGTEQSAGTRELNHRETVDMRASASLVISLTVPTGHTNSKQAGSII